MFHVKQRCGPVSASDRGENSDHTVQKGNRFLGDEGTRTCVDAPELQTVEQALVPTISVRRLADHDTTTRSHQPSGCGEGELGWSESPRGDRIE